MQSKIEFSFSGKLWKYEGQGGWYFISLPNDVSKEIRESLKWQEEGWGRMRATASIENIEWDTAIWFDKKANTYLLPVKSEIRKKAKLDLNRTFAVKILV